MCYSNLKLPARRRSIAKSILVIDNNISSKSALREIFKYMNYEVYATCNCKDGIESYNMTLAQNLLSQSVSQFLL